MELTPLGSGSKYSLVFKRSRTSLLDPSGWADQQKMLALPPPKNGLFCSPSHIALHERRRQVGFVQEHS
jgi:hypothetical protein